MSNDRRARGLFSRIHAGLFIAPLAAMPVHADALQDGAVVDQAQTAPATNGRTLQAIFMEVSGGVKWRPDAATPWRDAKVNDLLDPGAEIRTALNGEAALRVGKNSSILLDRATTIILPEILEEGETLTTRVALKHGRADFKVDRIGLDNDFQVQMGSTTMAVKGTGGTFAYGGFTGAAVSGSRFNILNAIEMQYFAEVQRTNISGGGRSTERNPDPVSAALASTIGPPPTGATAETGISDDQQAALGNNLPSSNVTDVTSLVSAVQQSGASGFDTGGISTPPFGGGGSLPGGGNSAGGGSSRPGGSGGGGQSGGTFSFPRR